MLYFIILHFNVKTNKNEVLLYFYLKREILNLYIKNGRERETERERERERGRETDSSICSMQQRGNN